MEEQSKKFNTIIIGSGLGGLTAGATLAKQGKKVLILEQHYIPGGCATTFKRKNYVFEVGLHEMDGFDKKNSKHEIFTFLDIFNNIDLIEVPELYYIKSKNSEFIMPHGADNVYNALCEKFPDDKKSIDAYFKMLKGVNKEAKQMPSKKWQIYLMYPLLPFLYPNVAKSTLTTVGKWMDRHIHNEELKMILCANILYYSDNPYKMTMLYFAIAQGSYILGGGYYIKGGSQNLSNYLKSVIEKHGGQVLLGKKVDKIHIENGKACGVAFKDTFHNNSTYTNVYADAIIANTAIPNIPDMLPAPQKNKLAKKIKKLEESCSLISIYMGFDTDISKYGVKHYSTFIKNSDTATIKDMHSIHTGAWEDRTFVFVDYSRIDSGLCPEGKSLAVICSSDYLSEWENLDEMSYKKKKEAVAQIFFKRLEKEFPGILEHLEYYEVGTSKTIEKYTLNYKGTPYGYAQTNAQAGIKRIDAVSSIKNLFFASAWTFPGGGFTAAIVSGYNIANKLNKKISWNQYDAEPLPDHRKVKILEVKNIAENTIELVFSKPLGFSYKPGQYAILDLNDPKFTHLDISLRPLSFASHTDEDVIRFAMRLSESSYKKSCNVLQAGDEATIYGPMGEFSLQTSTQKNICFLISGIGITPIVPMLMELEKNNYKGNVIIFYSNKRASATSYNTELDNLSLKNYTYIPVHTETDKRIDIQLIKNEIENLSDFNYYIVGTSSFLEGMKTILEENNVTAESIIVDDFG